VTSRWPFAVLLSAQLVAAFTLRIENLFWLDAHCALLAVTGRVVDDQHHNEIGVGYVLGHISPTMEQSRMDLSECILLELLLP